MGLHEWPPRLRPIVFNRITIAPWPMAQFPHFYITNTQMRNFKVEPLQYDVWPSFVYLRICVSGQRHHNLKISKGTLTFHHVCMICDSKYVTKMYNVTIPVVSQHSLCEGWRNFFSSYAVLSVFWFLAGNRFWCYLLTYLEYNTVVALCWFFGSGGR